jgi:hypothetical protein
MDVTADCPPVHFVREVGQYHAGLYGVENLDLNAIGGADQYQRLDARAPARQS